MAGDIVATGFGAGNAMEFHADRFQLDAATGSISITSSGTTLGGELGLYASQIHVASGNILDQLAVDAQYAGYQDDLNAPAAVGRPGGVLNAGVIWIESGSLQNILIQNTGTSELPAGFLANAVFVNDDEEVAGPPGSIDVVANGQLVTEGGTLTGVAVRDALVEGADLTPFTANSTINGCLLAGACAVPTAADRRRRHHRRHRRRRRRRRRPATAAAAAAPPTATAAATAATAAATAPPPPPPPPPPPEPPFEPGFTPTPGIQDVIQLVEDDRLPPPDFGNEDFIDDNDEQSDEGETSPITPPAPLFDTSELGDAAVTEGRDVGTSMRSTPGVTQSGDVDDPVSGSGNPGLIETAPPPPTRQEKQP